MSTAEGAALFEGDDRSTRPPAWTAGCRRSTVRTGSSLSTTPAPSWPGCRRDPFRHAGSHGELLVPQVVRRRQLTPDHPPPGGAEHGLQPARGGARRSPHHHRVAMVSAMSMPTNSGLSKANTTQRRRGRVPDKRVPHDRAHGFHTTEVFPWISHGVRSSPQKSPARAMESAGAGGPLPFGLCRRAAYPAPRRALVGRCRRAMLVVETPVASARMPAPPRMRARVVPASCGRADPVSA